MSRRIVAVLVDGPGTGWASVDPDLARAAGLGAYDATMGLLRAAKAGRSGSLPAVTADEPATGGEAA